MVMQSRFSPAGLRVLVVDDDLPWLKILEKMLKKCSYEVTTCGLALDALKLLRERKDGFDIVISDVNMPDMDGFKLLEHVGLEMDLPVIMMSVDGETSRVMKGVQHGACDYLVKPIRLKELKNIWQHVVRKRMHEVQDIEGFEDSNGTDYNDGHYGNDHTLLKKRKDVQNKHDEKESSDPSSSKKARVMWTVELHQNFVNAVNQIGIDSDKVGPKKILDLMNVPWLTRENVASHLQKYRLYLSRLRKKGETESSFEGMKNVDHSPKESSGSFSLQDSPFGQQNDVSSNYMHPGNQLPVKPKDSTPLDVDQESRDVLQLTGQRKPFNTDITDPDRDSGSQSGFNHTFGPLETSINNAQFDSLVTSQYHWTAEAREMQFKPEFNPHSNSEDCFKFDQPPRPVMQQQNAADFLESSPGMTPGPSISDTNNLPLIDVKPINGKLGCDEVNQLTPIEGALPSFSAPDPELFGCIIDMKPLSFSHDSGSMEEVPLRGSIQSFHLYPKSDISSSQGLEPNFNIALDMNNQISFQGSVADQSSIFFGLESTSGSTQGLTSESLLSYWLQSDAGTPKDLGFGYGGFSDFKFAEHISDTPAPAYTTKFGLDYDCFFDYVEYPIPPDQGLTWV